MVGTLQGTFLMVCVLFAVYQAIELGAKYYKIDMSTGYNAGAFLVAAIVAYLTAPQFKGYLQK